MVSCSCFNPVGAGEDVLTTVCLFAGQDKERPLICAMLIPQVFFIVDLRI